MSFWRIQYKENWQVITWYPHIVHRVGKKNDFHFATEGEGKNTDGMNSDRYMDATLCSTYGGEYFMEWGKMSADEILACLQDLTPAYRTVFNLYVVEGYSHKEIAKTLEITESTSRSNLVKARIKLKNILHKKAIVYER